MESDYVTSPTGRRIPVPEGFSIREGRPSDLDSVTQLALDLGIVGDYTPGLWLKWMKEPNRSTIVVTKGDQVMALLSSASHDGGKHVSWSGGRTHPSARGKGFVIALLLYQYEKFPNYDEILAQSSHCEFSLKMREEALRKGVISWETQHWLFADVGRRIRWNIEETVDKIQTAEKQLQKYLGGVDFTISPITTKEEMDAVFLQDEKTHALFPNGYFGLQPTVYKANPEHSALMLQDFRKVLVHRHNDLVTSLSVGSHLSCPEGTLYHFVYFGDGNLSSLLSHFLEHLREIPKHHAVCGGIVSLWFLLPSSTNMEEFMSVVCNVLGLQGKQSNVVPLLWQMWPNRKNKTPRPNL